VVEPDRGQLTELARRLRDRRIVPDIAAEYPLAEAITAVGPNAPRLPGKTVIRATPGW
jgi:NADPH:quinone reductase-like Zn-dependent oxidoreductase